MLALNWGITAQEQTLLKEEDNLRDNPYMIPLMLIIVHCKTNISALFAQGSLMIMGRLTDEPSLIRTLHDHKRRTMIRNQLQFRIMLLEFKIIRAMMMKRLLKRMSLKRKMRIWRTTVTML
jgi:hypothetical protein